MNPAASEEVMTLRLLRHAFEAAGCDSLGGVRRTEARHVHVATKPRIRRGDGEGGRGVGHGPDRGRGVCRCADLRRGGPDGLRTGAAEGRAVDPCRRHRSASFGDLGRVARARRGDSFFPGKHVGTTLVKGVSRDSSVSCPRGRPGCRHRTVSGDGMGTPSTTSTGLGCFRGRPRLRLASTATPSRTNGDPRAHFIKGVSRGSGRDRVGRCRCRMDTCRCVSRCSER